MFVFKSEKRSGDLIHSFIATHNFFFQRPRKLEADQKLQLQQGHARGFRSAGFISSRDSSSSSIFFVFVALSLDLPQFFCF